MATKNAESKKEEFDYDGKGISYDDNGPIRQSVGIISNSRRIFLLNNYVFIRETYFERKKINIDNYEE